MSNSMNTYDADVKKILNLKNFTLFICVILRYIILFDIKAE